MRLQQDVEAQSSQVYMTTDARCDGKAFVLGGIDTTSLVPSLSPESIIGDRARHLGETARPGKIAEGTEPGLAIRLIGGKAGSGATWAGTAVASNGRNAGSTIAK